MRAADVDDVLQDVFLRMQRALPELRDEERFGGWVYAIARFRRRRHAAVTQRERGPEDPVVAHRGEHGVSYVFEADGVVRWHEEWAENGRVTSSEVKLVLSPAAAKR